MSFFEVSNLSFAYPGGNRVLENISFKVERGSHVVIAGGNGSGKSTLVRLLAGLLSPSSGEILIEETSFHDSDALARDVRVPAGLVYQNPAHQIVATVVREDTAFGPENLELNSLEIRERVETALNMVSLASHAKRATHQLSAGQQQRLALAGILALQADCLILDEADSMLNPRGRQQQERLLQDLLGRGYTVIRVSHDMEQAFRADKLLILHEGSLVREGGPELLVEEDLEQWHLTAPPVLALGRKIKKKGLIVSAFPFPESCPGEGELLEAIGFGKQSRALTGWELPEPNMPAFREHKSGAPVLELERVSCSYGQKGASAIKALEDISFSLFQGETVAVTGPAGAGKSTFLQVLNSLFLPQKGRIRIFGLNPLDRKTDLSSLRTRAALVMQQPEKQLFAPLVGDDVAFGPRMAGLKGRELSLRVREAMESAGLPFKEFRDRPVKSLSGGQKRKAALAGILALKPEILLLDEPAAGLDPMAAQDMIRLLLDLQNQGLGQIIVSHSMEQALALARRLVVLEQGHIVYDGPSEAFFRERNPETLGLEYPLSARLALKLGCPEEKLPVTEEQLIWALNKVTFGELYE